MDQSDPIMHRRDLGAVTVIRFQREWIMDEDDIQSIGEDLVRLVDIDHRHRLVLDLEPVEYPSSAFLGKILWVMVKLRKEGGRMALCHLSPTLTRMFLPHDDESLPGLAFFQNEQDALEWAAR